MICPATGKTVIRFIGMRKIKLYPPLLTLLLILAMLLSHIILSSPLLISAPFAALGHTLGVVLIVMGLCMNLWSARWFKLKKTTIDPSENAVYLAQEGLYRISRNPMYLGLFIMLLGVSIYLGEWLSFLVPPLFLWIVTLRFIRREEQILFACFGEDYLQYKARVRRWI